jgi:hypothetical protein
MDRFVMSKLSHVDQKDFALRQQIASAANGNVGFGER